VTAAEQQVIDAAVHTLRADAELVGSIRRGERFTVRTQDTSGAQIGEGVALAAAVEECVRQFADTESVPVSDAYLAVGLLLDVTVCQVVNPRRSVVVTLGSGMDRLLRPRLTASVPEEEKGNSA
jgi:acetamidase/formamidase